MLLIALLREEGRQGPPYHTSHDDVGALFAEAGNMCESEEDLSSRDRLGIIIQNVYLFTVHNLHKEI